MANRAQRRAQKFAALAKQQKTHQPTNPAPAAAAAPVLNIETKEPINMPFSPELPAIEIQTETAATATAFAFAAPALEPIAPETDEERTLVQQIVDAEWRILRIPSLEYSVWALGHRKLADQFTEVQDPEERESLIRGEILM